MRHRPPERGDQRSWVVEGLRGAGVVALATVALTLAGLLLAVVIAWVT